MGQVGEIQIMTSIYKEKKRRKERKKKREKRKK